MFFRQVYDKTLSHASYVIGCQVAGTALVIDPQRDVDVYLQIAAENNLKITGIAETHIHADFLCGSRELAALTGATMYLSDEGGPDWQYSFDHVGLKHGSIIKLGNLTFEVVHTPGHTPESITFLLRDHPATDAIVMAFTGDFVFVGDIGRPDLLEVAAGIKNTKVLGAQQMYDSISKFAKLPEYIQVWPAHGAGSACGKALGAVPSSTVGYEKIRNWAFQYEDDKQGFVDTLLDGQPEPPKYFAMMKHLNKEDRHLLTSVPKHPKLTTSEFDIARGKNLTIIDTRNKVDFAKSHLPGAINIQNNNSFATWAGWFLNYTEQFILIAEESQMEDLTRKLMRIGLDNIFGFITDLSDSKGDFETVDNIPAEELQAAVGNDAIQIVDVRNSTEFKDGHIEGAVNAFVGTLPDNLDLIDRNREVIIHCQAGDRSSIAYSILQANGFTNIKNYPGGMKEWKELGNKVVTSN